MSEELFEDVIILPESGTKIRFDQLVGLDNEKELLLKQSSVLLNPSLLTKWSNDHYKKEIGLLKYVLNRPPLFIFSGDVGTGKTTLAETFGDAIGRQEDIEVTLYRLSLKTRGNGTVGDMTKMISNAFETVLSEGKKSSRKTGKPKNAYILVIDEADALAQTRESAQMHHEDRAGVNALIRGIDTISNEHLPIIVVMCTNRLSAIDPAVQRRAINIFNFTRPNEAMRLSIFETAFSDCEVKPDQLESLVDATGPLGDRKYGYTYSDIIQRLLPNIVMRFFPLSAIDFTKVTEMAKETAATPPFKQEFSE